jgi:flagellar assembly factor FliW
MAQVLTRDFATIDYDSEEEIRFPNGLPGFREEKRFLLLESEALAPILFLQSLSTPGLCFLTISVFLADPEYQIGNLQADEGELTSSPAEDNAVLAILTASADGGFTANLLAPILLNLQTRIAVQAVRGDSRYSHQHALSIGAAVC